MISSLTQRVGHACEALHSGLRILMFPDRIAQQTIMKPEDRTEVGLELACPDSHVWYRTPSSALVYGVSRVLALDVLVKHPALPRFPKTAMVNDAEKTSTTSHDGPIELSFKAVQKGGNCHRLVYVRLRVRIHLLLMLAGWLACWRCRIAISWQQIWTSPRSDASSFVARWHYSIVPYTQFRISPAVRVSCSEPRVST